MSEEPITLGAVINNLVYLVSGAGLGFGFSRINAYLQRRKEDKEKE